MRSKFRSRSAAIVIGIVVVLVGAGAAVAYWTNTGAGTGTADTGTNAAVVVNQTSILTTPLAPGVAAQPLSGDFDNPNAGPVYITAVTATVTGTDTAGCGATDYVIAGTSTVPGQVPAGDGTGAWSGLTIQFNNKVGTNQDACKGAVVNIAYTSS